ncbi:MAG: hypothetical protein NTV86_05290 [Planctomycetota bacterium]|nr:hypothetical protein [Planctomycetota bacterium]
MTAENQATSSRTLATAIAGLAPGEPIGHANLTLVPLLGEARGQILYLLASEAIRAGSLTVTEVDQQAMVSELLATNSGPQKVFLLDGEELVGAKQNRILNTSILLLPGTKIRIPVSCVEQGRWREVSLTLQSGSCASSSLRARKSRDVSESLRRSGRAQSDQGAVWENVAFFAREVASVRPAAMAMSDVIFQRRDSLQAYVESMPYPPYSRGVMAAINGRFVAADVFDRPQTLEAVWPRLLTGYAIDALAQGREARRLFTAKAASVLLERVGQVPCDSRPTAGAGEDWRIETHDIVGQALVVDGVCVHLSVFPNDGGEDRAEREPGIAPPSRRRRTR